MTVYAPDNVMMTSTSNGTGDLVLDGTISGRRSVPQAVAASDYVYGNIIPWVIEDVAPDGGIQQSEVVFAAVIDDGGTPTLSRAAGLLRTAAPGLSIKMDVAGTGPDNQTRVFPVSDERALVRLDDFVPPNTTRARGANLGPRQIRTDGTGARDLDAIRFADEAGATDYVEILAALVDAASGTEDASLRFRAMLNGALSTVLDLDPAGGISFFGEPKRGPQTLAAPELWLGGSLVTGANFQNIGRTQGSCIRRAS